MDITKMALNSLIIQLILTKIIYALASISASSATSTNGLFRVRVSLPPFRRPGEMAQLKCDYDLGNDTLYAVKWYKENEEFYRYVAKENPPANSHKVEGVDVDVSSSDSRKVILRSVSLRSGGLYRCEVSAEAPSFASAQSEARMEIISLPNDDPRITGVQLQYHIGDEIQLNCTSARSYPASTLHWYINDQLVTSKASLVHYPITQHRRGLLTTKLGLKFNLSSWHFRDGSMRVKCVASIAPLFRKDDRSSAIENLPINDLREAMLLVKNAGNFNYLSAVLISATFLNVLFGSRTRKL